MEFDLSFPTCYLHAILLCTTTIALSCLLILSFVFVTSLSYPNKLLGCALPSHFLSHLILDMEFDFSFHPSCLHGLLFCVPLPSSHFPPPPSYHLSLSFNQSILYGPAHFLAVSSPWTFLCHLISHPILCLFNSASTPYPNKLSGCAFPSHLIS